MKDFFKAFLSFGLATSIEKLLGFIILPIYTRYFSTTEYGIIDLTGTVLSIAIIFGILQLETSLQRYFYEHDGIKKKLIITNVYLLVFTFSCLIGLFVFMLSSSISDWLFDSRKYSFLIKLISIQIPFQNLSMLGLVLLRYEKQNLKFLSVVILKVSASLFFVYIFVIFLNMGLVGVFLAQLSALSISTILVTYFIKSHFVFRFSKILSLKLLNYSLPQFPARMGSLSLGQANRFFMLSFLSLQAIGIYSVSLKIASAIQLVNTAFIMAWAPFMHSLFKRENNEVIFAAVLPLVGGATFFFVIVISLLSKEMVMLIASENFFEAHRYVGGLSLFFALYIIKEVVDIGPKIKEKTKYLTYNFFASVSVNILSLYVFINLYGLSGVVIAMMLTNITLVCISWFTSNKLYYIPFDVLAFLVAIIPAIGLSMLSMLLEVSLSVRIVILGASVIYYGSFCLIHYRKFKELG